MKRSSISDILLITISSILTVLSFPPFDIEILAWLALVLLFTVIIRADIKASISYGLLYGFIIFAAGLSWLGVFGWFVPFTLALLLSLAYALFCALYKTIKNRVDISDVLLIPVIWVAMEYARSFIFPAGIMGYSQYGNIRLIQISSITGVLGISYLIALANAMIASLLSGFDVKKLIRYSAVMTAFIILTGVYGGYALSYKEKNVPVKVGLIQSDINLKWGQDYSSEKALEILGDLTARSSKERPRLVVWPESVIRDEIRINPQISSKVYDIVKRSNSYFLIGNNDMQIVNGAVKHYNSALFISPKGKILQQYNKKYVVPFWESFPIRDIFPYFKNVESKGACDAGSQFTVFKAPFGDFSALICFEGIFGWHAREFVKRGAEFIVNISNDGWSKSAAEHRQHASMDVFRAIENRVYYVRVGNSGVTGIIDRAGRYVKALPVYEKGYINGDIYPSISRTIYTKYGDWFGLACTFLTLILLISGLLPFKGGSRAQ